MCERAHTLTHAWILIDGQTDRQTVIYTYKQLSHQVTFSFYYFFVLNFFCVLCTFLLSLCVKIILTILAFFMLPTFVLEAICNIASRMIE